MYRVKEEFIKKVKENQVINAVQFIDVDKPVEIIGVEARGHYNLCVRYTKLDGDKVTGYIDRESLEEWK